MPDGRFVSYLRVSTDRQGRSGLGLEAQRAAVADYMNGGNWRLVSEVVEVESGKRNDRVKLAEAMNLCRAHRATLVIAKLDRLSRDAAFLMNLEAAGIEFVAVDMPNANRVTVRIMAVIAEEERRMISARTTAALLPPRRAERFWAAFVAARAPLPIRRMHGLSGRLRPIHAPARSCRSSRT